MSELREIKNVFSGLQTLYETHFPKVDPGLLHSLLIAVQKDPDKDPFYMLEIFTKPGTNIEKMRDYIMQKTGMVPSIHDNGTHYVVNQRLSLEFLRELSELDEVEDIAGDYTGGVTGRGASHEKRRSREVQ
jgi:hypothetical protein